MPWLLDTNIISELRRLKPEQKVLAFITDHPLEDLYISTVTQPDLIIAATALHHGFTIVTRDRTDFDKARVQVLNPWEWLKPLAFLKANLPYLRGLTFQPGPSLRLSAALPLPRRCSD